MNKKYIFTAITVFCTLIGFTSKAQLGDLPDHYLFSGEVKDVRGELGLTFLSDWGPVIDSTDFNLVGSDSDSNKFEHVFAIIDIAKLNLEDTDVSVDTKIAFWWILLEKAPDVVPMAKNANIWLEQKLWTSNKDLYELFIKNGRNCELADMNIEYHESGISYELRSSDTHLKVNYTKPDPEPRVLNYKLPSYATVWSKSLDNFQLYTFYDHIEQKYNSIELEVLKSDNLKLPDIMKESYSNSQIWGSNMYNWKARFAVYSHK